MRSGKKEQQRDSLLLLEHIKDSFTGMARSSGGRKIIGGSTVYIITSAEIRRSVKMGEGEHFKQSVFLAICVGIPLGSAHNGF